jgi:gliding motility-associated lipoprotein GldD
MKCPTVKFGITGLVLLTIFTACKENYSAKPRAYYRIDLPVKEYVPLQGDYPYRFEIPTYAQIKPYSGNLKNPDTTRYWINIRFPQFRSRIHITYKPVMNNLPKLIEDSHTFAFKHSIKADAINQKEFSNPQNHVYGILFDIKGNTASSLQFYMTDSTRHFLRGALYFDNEPNKDSIAPVNEFLRQDIERLIETLTWNTKN